MREKDNSLVVKETGVAIARIWQNYMSYDFMEGIKLSSEQIKVVDLSNEQLMINGSAGSGKSITLLFKLIKTMIKEEDGKKILYLSYNQALIDDAIKRANKSQIYSKHKKRHNVDFYTFHKMVYEVFHKMGKPIQKVNMKYNRMEEVTDDAIRRIQSIMLPYTNTSDTKCQYSNPKERLYKTHTAKFIRDEIFWIKANGFITEESYMDAARVGRGTIPRLEKSQRKIIFDIYEQYQYDMKNKYGKSMDLEDYALELIKIANSIPDKLKYDYIYIDEVQDLQPMQIKALTMMCKKQIVISGDNKQRIYKTSNHTYEALGLGKLRRRNLLDNFRSTKQIMKLANSISFQDIDNDKESDVHCVREGLPPKISRFIESNQYLEYLSSRIKNIQLEDPYATIAVIIRNDDIIHTGNQSAIQKYLKMKFSVIDINDYGRKYSYEKKEKQLIITDPYSVKGLEFDYVFIQEFDKNHYPLKSKLNAIDTFIEDKNKESGNYKKDLDDIINNEKRILYVAMTRAKKHLEMMYCAKSENMLCEFIKINK